MPMFDWRCYVCSHVVKDVLHFADLGECPRCHSRSWTKVMPAPNVRVVNGTPKFHGGSNERD